MKKLIRKLTGIILSLAMVCTMMPVLDMPVRADDETVTISEVNLTYDADTVSLNTAWTEAQINNLIKKKGTLQSTTDGVYVEYWSCYLLYYNTDVDKWYGVGDGIVNASTTRNYGFDYSLRPETGYDWTEAVKSGDFSDLVIKFNGTIVTSDCAIKYRLSDNSLAITVPVGGASDTPIITGFSVSDTSLNIERGASYTFTGTVSGTVEDKSIVWSLSGAKSSATEIDSSTGVLTVGADEDFGTLTVVATAKADSTKTATIKVNVIEAVYISSVEITTEDTTLYQGSALELSVDVEGTQTDKSVTWSVSGNSSSDTAVDDEGRLTIGSDETASSITVKATANKDSSKYDTITFTVKECKRVATLILAYDKDIIDLNTAWTENQVKNRVKSAGTLTTSTNGVSVDKNDCYLEYYNADASSWYGIGDGTLQVSTTRKYGLEYALTVQEGYDWPAAVSDDDFTGLTIKANGVDVTEDCDFRYNEYWNELYVIFPIAAASEEPRVTGVAITDSSISLERGESYTFTGAASGTAEDLSVIWSISGANSNSTVIGSTTGTLTIGEDETSDSIKVTATSKADSSKSVYTTVTVEDPIPVSKNIEDHTVQIEYTSVTYDGTAKTPAVTIQGLKEDVAYEVTYSNNVNAGTATVTVTGIGDFSGTVVKNFTIGKASYSITTTAYSGTYDGKAHTITISGVKSGSTLYYRTSTSASWSTTKPKGTNAGKITVYYKITNSNYKDITGNKTIIIKPAATTLSSVANGAGGMIIKWTKNAQATGYKLYRKVNSGSWSLVKNITSNSTVSYTDTAATTNGAKYQYKIYAYKTSNGSTLTGAASSILTKYRLTRPAISSITAASKAFTVKWGKNSKATGYQIMYSRSSSFASGNKTVTISSASTVSKKIASLLSGKKYYVKVRSFKTVGSTKYYSAWSAVKGITTK